MNVMDNTEAFVYIRDKKYAITGMRYEKGKLVGFQMNEKRGSGGQIIMGMSLANVVIWTYF